MTDNIVVLVALICINAVFVQMYFGPLFTVPIEILGTRTAGMSTGFSNFFANIGSFSFVYLIGALKDTTGSFGFGFNAMCYRLSVYRSPCTNKAQGDGDNNASSKYV